MQKWVELVGSVNKAAWDEAETFGICFGALESWLRRPPLPLYVVVATWGSSFDLQILSISI